MTDINVDVLRKLRKAKGYSQSTFSHEIGMKLSTYAYKEKIGQFEEPELAKIVKVLGISNETLAVRDGSDKTKTNGHPPNESDLREIISLLKRENDLLRKLNETHLNETIEILKEVQSTVNDLPGKLSQELSKGKTDVFVYPSKGKKGKE